MRALSLNEKITLKGKFAFYGLALPRLNMVQASFLWPRVAGKSITQYPIYRG